MHGYPYTLVDGTPWYDLIVVEILKLTPAAVARMKARPEYFFEWSEWLALSPIDKTAIREQLLAEIWGLA